MPKVKLDVGATIDFLNKDELDGIMGKYHREAQEIERAKLTGIKWMRLPRLYATPASGTVVLGEVWSANGTAQPYTDQIAGPNQGYVWSVRRLSVSGLGTGNSPDLLNIYRNGVRADPVWQLNGNSFAYTFGKGEFLLYPDERVIAASVGSMVSTTQIVLSGDLVQVPAEMTGKLL